MKWKIMFTVCRLNIRKAIRVKVKKFRKCSDKFSILKETSPYFSAEIRFYLWPAQTPQFVDYQSQVVRNVKRFCKSLIERGYSIVTGGTDIHCWFILQPNRTTDAGAGYIVKENPFSCNKKTVPGDQSQH